MAGKGSSPRPVKGDVYRAEWERIFGKPVHLLAGKPRRPVCGAPPGSMATDNKDNVDCLMCLRMCGTDI